MGRKVVAVVVRCVFVLKGKFVASHFIIKSRAVGLPGGVLFLSSIHRASCGCETHFYHRPWWLRVRPGIAIVVYIILVLPPSVPPSLPPSLSSFTYAFSSPRPRRLSARVRRSCAVRPRSFEIRARIRRSRVCVWARRGWRASPWRRGVC